MKIIRAKDTQMSSWSGGKTTQLFIYPQNSNYSKRDFDIRISTAQINVAESTFTKLPGIQRKLMILNGNLEIIHKNKYKKCLNKFDSDNFIGNWDTTSKGIVTDFNVMTTEKYNSSLLATQLKSDNILLQNIDKQFFFHIIYLLKGELSVKTNSSQQKLNERDVMIFNNYISFKRTTIKAVFDSEIISTTICK